MLCQHCENAPCEYVCPVNATVHSPDGLNEMVYNRCVGTRFCSNNCPYKVRRFNWFDWTDREPANQGCVELQRNPDVTVRERGVMEKCTYCVQRIRARRDRARASSSARSRPARSSPRASRRARRGDPVRLARAHRTAEMVAVARASRAAYAVLHELGTRPRTQYLARIDNPNPEIG